MSNNIFISAPPYDSPTNIVKVLKGILARQLYKRFPELKFGLRKGHIWSPSYYVGTAGNMSAKTIQKYIQNQIVLLNNEEERLRNYIKHSSCNSIYL